MCCPLRTVGGLSSRRNYVPLRHWSALIQMPLCGQSLSSGPGHSKLPELTLRKGWWRDKGKKKGNLHLDLYLTGISDGPSPRSPLTTPPPPLPRPHCILSKATLVTLHQAFHLHSTMHRRDFHSTMHWREVSGDVPSACPSRCIMGNGCQSSPLGKGSGI